MRIDSCLKQTKSEIVSWHYMMTKTRRVIYRSLVFAIIVVFMAHIVGCTTLVSVPTAHASLEDEKVLYVELSSGKKIKVKEPRFEDDVLAGITPKYGNLSGPYEEIRIPLHQIALIRVERFSSKKTILTLAGLTFAVGTFFYFISQLPVAKLN